MKLIWNDLVFTLWLNVLLKFFIKHSVSTVHTHTRSLWTIKRHYCCCSRWNQHGFFHSTLLAKCFECPLCFSHCPNKQFSKGVLNLCILKILSGSTLGQNSFQVTPGMIGTHCVYICTDGTEVIVQLLIPWHKSRQGHKTNQLLCFSLLLGYASTCFN